MTVTLTLPPETAQIPRDRAAHRGLSLEEFLAQLATREAGMHPDADFEAGLDRLAAMGSNLQPLPGKLDRAELYADHD